MPRASGAKRPPYGKSGTRPRVKGGSKPRLQGKRKITSGRAGGSPSPRAQGWYTVMAAVLVVCLMVMGKYAFDRVSAYMEFKAMRDTVENAGFYDGISIDGVDVSGMTLDEAIARLQEKDQARRDKLNVTLVCGDRTWTLTADEVDYASNYLSVARHAFQIGRGGSLEERYAAVRDTRNMNAAYSVNYGYDKTLLHANVEAFAAELTVEPRSAQVTGFEPKTHTFSFSEGKNGYRVDADALYEQVRSAVAGGVSTVEVQREKVTAKTDTASLMDAYGEISSAVTNASSSTGNRITNIRLALSMINGKAIAPGATFSFNGTVGERTAAKGFKLAGAYENGISTEAYGGGICQVSTTLFNAAMKAGLTLVERSPHSKPVAYVDKGKDAAVDWPGTDLKFRNDTDEPVYIYAYLSKDNRVHVSLYGRKLPQGQYIKIDAVTTKTIQPGKDQVSYTSSLPRGESRVVTSARYGYKAEAYRTWYNADGSVRSRELLCRSSYAAAPAVIEVGK